MRQRGVIPSDKRIGVLIAGALVLACLGCLPAPSSVSGPEALERLPGAVTDIWQPSPRTGRLVATVDRGAGIYLSDDAGTTWTAAATSGELAAYQLLELPDQPGLLAATNLGIWRSDETQRRWGWVLGERLGAFALALDGAGRPFAALHESVAWADPTGRRWSGTRGRIARAGLLALVPASDRPDHLFAGTNTAGIWETTDGGRSWQPRYPTRAVVSRLVRLADGTFFAVAGQTLVRWRDRPDEPDVLILPGATGRPLALTAAGDRAYAGTAAGELFLVGSDGAQAIDRLPEPVTALRALADQLCIGTAAGQVICRPRPGATE